MARHVEFSWIKSCTSCFSYRDPWNLFEWLLSFKMFLSSQKQFLLFLKFVSMSSPIMNTGYENACLPTSVFTWSIKSHFSSVVLKFKVKSFALICSFSRSFIPQFDLSFLEYGLYSFLPDLLRLIKGSSVPQKVPRQIHHPCIN